MPSAAHIAGYYGLPLDASPEFVRGYLDVMESRFDQRGQGVACGKGWIPRSKKCSSDKAKQTSKEAKARTVEKSKARAELKRAVKGAKGQKARVKVIDPPQISREESLALLDPTVYGDYKSRERGYALRTSTLRQIEKDHPDLAPVINDARARDHYSPDTAEVGDVMIFRLPEGSRKFVGISPETAYMQITSVKNGRVRGIPMDEFGMPLTTKAQHIKADVTPPRGKDRKGWAWIKVNFPQDEWKGQSRYSSEAQKQRARQLTRTDSFLQGYADIMRLDTVRPSCMECVEKHLGAALVLMGEAEAGYPEHKLLAIGHLHEAADESADRMPELSALLRDIRKRYQQGEPIEFENILEALSQHGVWRFDRKGEA